MSKSCDVAKKSKLYCVQKKNMLVRISNSRLRTVRLFSSTSLSSFIWEHRDQQWDYSYALVSPDEVDSVKATIVIFPSTTLLSSREEWRSCAEYLADLGYQSVLMEWPGWHQTNSPLNWALEDDIMDKTIISTFTKFTHSALHHITSLYSATPLHVAASGGCGTVHIIRALTELGQTSGFKSVTCFSPTWRFYLTRYVEEGYPRKLSRRQSIAAHILDTSFVRSKMMYRIYKSKFGLSKLTRRLYEEGIQHNEDLLETKKAVITRDRPLTIDAAMMVGRFDPVISTHQLIETLMNVDPSNSVDHQDDSDDDDSLLNIKVPNWIKSEPSTADPAQPVLIRPFRLHLVFPQDAVAKDKAEMQLVAEWAKHHNVHVSDIPGKLFCHEESPALTATIIHDYLSELNS